MVIEDQGQGPVVVMVHGLGGTSNSFQSLLPYLEGYRVLRVDLPGAGRSLYRPGLPGLAGLVSSLKNALQAAEIARAHFVGHSLGTLICQHLAVASPSLFASLTLFGALLEPKPTARHALRERAVTVRKDGMADVAEAVATGSTAEPSRHRNSVIHAFVRESLMRQNPSGYAAHCEALSEATAAAHDAIECSTLLITGEYDAIAPIEMGQTLAEKIRTARLEIIADAGHWLMIEAPERSGQLLRDHLSEQHG